ncbi:hypothetical protein C8Q73DRAFT_534885 [Cubamyces lactineus]|nr:hypothetical protein C8Q73DRAFT_534885 [Cubamyces lactineus]
MELQPGTLCLKLLVAFSALIAAPAAAGVTAQPSSRGAYVLGFSDRVSQPKAVTLTPVFLVGCQRSPVRQASGAQRRFRQRFCLYCIHPRLSIEPRASDSASGDIGNGPPAYARDLCLPAWLQL